VRASVGLEVPGFKAFIPPAPYEVPDPVKAAIAHYWKDPVANGDAVPSPNGTPQPCHRFTLADAEVTGLDRDGAGEVAEILAGGAIRFDELVTNLNFPQLQLVKRLLRAGIVTNVQAEESAA
jgi:hypothetical protein